MSHFVLQGLISTSTCSHSTKTFSIICICFVFLLSTIPSVKADVVILRQSVEFSYQWGNWFLDLIRGDTQPLSGFNLDFTRRFNGEITWETYKHVEPIAMAYKGYLICLLCGFLFIFFMPLIGLIFCCCRCCGNCGGRPRPMDSKHAKCKRVFFTTSLLILNTAILLCVVLALINNQLLHETFTNKDEKINTLAQLKNSSTEFEKSLNVLQSKLVVTSDTSSFRVPMESAINKCVDFFCDTFQTTKTGSALLNESDYLWNSPSAIRLLASNMDTFQNNFEEAANALREAEMEVKKVLSNCDPEQADICKELEAFIPVRITTRLSDELSGQIKSWANEMKSNLDDLQTFSKLSDTIRNFSESAKDSQKKRIQETAEFFSSSKFVGHVVDATKLAASIISRSTASFNRALRGEENVYFGSEARTLPELVGEIDSYRMYAFVAFCCIVVLVVIFYYLGMCFGICGERPYEDASVCNGGVGANLLMAGVAFTFLFAWLLMIITTVLFLVGGPYQTEACRYLTPNSSYEDVRKLDNYFTLMSQLESISSDGITYDKNDALDLVAPLLYNCTREYISLMQFLKKSNLLSRLPLNMPADWDFRVLDDAITANYSDYAYVASNLASKVPLLPNELSDVILDLNKMTAMERTNYYAFIIKAAELKESSKGNSKIRFAKLRLFNLRGIAVEVNKNLNDVIRLKSSIQQLEQILEKMRAPMDVKEISVLKLHALRRLIRDAFETVLTPMLNDTPCYNVGVAAQNAVSAICINSLRPFNGYWYGLGVCLWLMLPTLIFAVKLAGLYRKIEKYTADYEEPDYMSYQGFYMTPGENMPLERKSRGNATQPTARGPSGKDLNRGNPNYHQLPVYSYDAYE